MIKTDQPSARAALPESLTDALTPECDEGAAAARNLLTGLASGLSLEDRASMFTDAVGGLIDFNLNWNSLDATQQRLREFSGVLVAAMEADVSARTVGKLLITPELREGGYMNLDEMAQNIAKIKYKPAKKLQVHLLCESLVARLKGGAQ